MTCVLTSLMYSMRSPTSRPLLSLSWIITSVSSISMSSSDSVLKSVIMSMIHSISLWDHPLPVIHPTIRSERVIRREMIQPTTGIMPMANRTMA